MEQKTAFQTLLTEIREIFRLFFHFRFKELIITPTENQTLQLCRYLLTAVIATIVDYLGLFIGTELCGLHYLIGTALGYLAGIFVTYFLSKHLVFSTRAARGGQGTELIGNFVIGLIALGLTELLMWVIKDLLHANLWVARVIVTVLVFFWNYLARKKFLYR